MSKIQQLLEFACNDESLKNNIKANPKQVLANFGIELPDATQVEVHENTVAVTNYIIPELNGKPSGVDIEEQNSIASILIQTALEDQSFKAKLLQEPKSAIAEVTGFHLPTNQQICVYENTPLLKHIVLPINPMSSELSDAELEVVAGGLDKRQIVGLGCGATSATLSFTNSDRTIAGLTGAASAIAGAFLNGGRGR